MKDLLEGLRNQIDTIDEEIIYLLSRRFELVRQVGKIKKENNILALQQNRWDKLMKNLLLEANDKGVNAELVKNIWEEIHKESLKIEE